MKNDGSNIVNGICYHGGFERATHYIDCEKTDCKTCECNQPMKTKKRKVVLTDKISVVTGLAECKDCGNDKLNGWSSHCKTCGMPIVF